MQASVEKMIRGYLGFLVGTGKAALTISSYKGDLRVFQDFLKEQKLKFHELNQRDFEKFHSYLQKKGMSRNTRRRKIITARSLYKYAFVRKKIGSSPAQFAFAPERMERLPWLPTKEEYESFLEAIEKSLIGQRNRILVQLLRETGISVAELCSLAWSDWKKSTDKEGRSHIEIPGKKKRSLLLSKTLSQELKVWSKMIKGKYLFPGFNRHGISTSKMTPRGVEIFFRHLEKKTGLKLKPKTLRHFAVIEWLKSGVEEKEILRRLGVASTYSLALYHQFLEHNPVGKNHDET